MQGVRCGGQPSIQGSLVRVHRHSHRIVKCGTVFADLSIVVGVHRFATVKNR